MANLMAIIIQKHFKACVNDEAINVNVETADNLSANTDVEEPHHPISIQEKLNLLLKKRINSANESIL